MMTTQNQTPPDVTWAVQHYEAVRDQLPKCTFSNSTQTADHLEAIADHFDAFLLDAFGVLNRGEAVIEGAVARMSALRSLGKKLIVLTNSASKPRSMLLEKYHQFGFDFKENEVVSSRDVAFENLPTLRQARPWGAWADPHDDFADATFPIHRLQDDAKIYDQVGGFLFLAKEGWSDQAAAILSNALLKEPRPLIIANPDLVAPRETDMSLEPGYLIQQVTNRLARPPIYFGKPFPHAYDVALDRLSGVAKERIAMVGDTLHTDVIGGANAGIKTVLVANHGLFKGVDVRPFMEQTGIWPDWIVQTT